MPTLHRDDLRTLSASIAQRVASLGAAFRHALARLTTTEGRRTEAERRTR